MLPKLVVAWWPWSVLGPRGIGNRWSSAGTSGHGGYDEPQVTDASRPRPRPLEQGGGGFESHLLRRENAVAYRAGGGDQGVWGFGWSSPSTQMSARSL
jgi:hypothetical protein